MEKKKGRVWNFDVSISSFCSALQLHATVFHLPFAFSQGWLSRHTGDSDELRPVTSVTNSWDSYSLHADSEVDMPDSNLWVLEADDPNINSRLINAIVHGKFDKYNYELFHYNLCGFFLFRYLSQVHKNNSSEA